VDAATVLTWSARLSQESEFVEEILRIAIAGLAERRALVVGGHEFFNPVVSGSTGGVPVEPETST
jgi:hypothetical protein